MNQAIVVAQTPNPPKHAGGRPTKYKPQFGDMLVEFFDIEPYVKEVVEEKVEYYSNGAERSSSRKYRYTPTKMPTLFRFAESIGVSQQVLRDWSERHPEFLTAYARAKEMQKEWLISNGLSGAAQPQFAIFTAKNVTDMREKVETEATINHQVFFVPKEIAEKHGLVLPEGTPPKQITSVNADVREIARSS